MRLALLLWLLFAGAAAAAPDHGLMWNRTGLPLVFPLQIRTDPGRDTVLVMRDAETGEAAVAGYIEGGRFFRILVPPGTYELDFATGTEWVDEETLFGAETRRFSFPEPLTFAVEGLARKSGHLIDLREEGRMASRALDLCQERVVAGVPQAPSVDPEEREVEGYDFRDYRRYGDGTRRDYATRDPRFEGRELGRVGDYPKSYGYRPDERPEMRKAPRPAPDRTGDVEIRERLCG
ncbi:hypothetical protein LX81_02368 [Palleronia aestuarii]|uniref:Uncharacterized protein n=1 Tax=Palleronia aestuarii TaxID=568105 RepID=A0A2W7NR69_9RHOB|nr:hypothetical protein [Palleronia aestuarii]PZX15736.1 hypothetical protein LX81_02368 [Palleronia aestuarii]